MFSLHATDATHDSFSAPIRAMRSVARATSAPPGHVPIVQNLKHLVRPCPTLDIDLFAGDAARRLQHPVVLTTASAAFTLAVRRHLDSACSRTHERYMAKKSDGTSQMSVF